MSGSTLSVYRYDVFISYKSQQESWAKRIAETLASFGLRVWRDHDGGIRLGEKWSDEINLGIRDSQKMVVLWSNEIATNSNSIVHREIQAMTDYMVSDENRRLIPVNLDDTPLNYMLSAFQADVKFRPLFEHYGSSNAEKINAIDWYAAIKPLVTALGIQDVMEVRFVAAAMTREQATQLIHNPEEYAHNRKAFEAMQSIMNLTRSPEVIERYGDSPDDWLPFPHLSPPGTVRELLSDYDSQKKEWLRQQGSYARWILVSYSEQLTSKDRDIRADAREFLHTGPCLVVIDPLSLLHREVYTNIITNGGLQNHHEAYILGVSPFVAQMHQDLFDIVNDVDEFLQQMLEAVYDRFRQAFQPYNRVCVMSVEHEHQFSRWLQIAADDIVTTGRTPMRTTGIHSETRATIRKRQPFAPRKQIIAMVHSN